MTRSPYRSAADCRAETKRERSVSMPVIARRLRFPCLESRRFSCGSCLKRCLGRSASPGGIRRGDAAHRCESFPRPVLCAPGNDALNRARKTTPYVRLRMKTTTTTMTMMTSTTSEPPLRRLSLPPLPPSPHAVRNAAPTASGASSFAFKTPPLGQGSESYPPSPNCSHAPTRDRPQGATMGSIRCRTDPPQKNGGWNGSSQTHPVPKRRRSRARRRHARRHRARDGPDGSPHPSRPHPGHRDLSR
jgi:hypothetical protein